MKQRAGLRRLLFVSGWGEGDEGASMKPTPAMIETKRASRAKAYGRRGGQKATGAQKLCIEGELVNMEEIARRLGISPSAARKRHKRALASGAQRITWEALGLVSTCD